MPPAAAPARGHRPPPKPAPKKISIAKLPVTGSDLFGREEDIAFLDEAWANKDANVVTIVAWAGVGKSTLVNHWLRRMAAEQYRSAQLVFGWSFYRQGASGGPSSTDEFIDAALAWFADPDPRLGTAWEKGERLGKLISHRRTLLVRSELSGHLAHNVRQGVHARKVMKSYQTWFGEGPELSVLRMLGLFDRPADEKALRVLLNPNSEVNAIG